MNPIQIAESLQILHVNANNSVTPCIRTSTKLWRNILDRSPTHQAGLRPPCPGPHAEAR